MLGRRWWWGGIHKTPTHLLNVEKELDGESHHVLLVGWWRPVDHMDPVGWVINIETCCCLDEGKNSVLCRGNRKWGFYSYIKCKGGTEILHSMIFLSKISQGVPQFLSPFFFFGRRIRVNFNASYTSKLLILITRKPLFWLSSRVKQVKEWVRPSPCLGAEKGVGLLIKRWKTTTERNFNVQQ